MVLKAKIKKISYVVELTSVEFDKLESLDFLDDVEPRLISKGAYHIDYSGHFGTKLFFEASSDTDISVIEINSILS